MFNLHFELDNAASLVISIAIKHFELFSWPLLPECFFCIGRALWEAISCDWWFFLALIFLQMNVKWLNFSWNQLLGTSEVSFCFYVVWVVAVLQTADACTPSPMSKCSLLCNNWHNTKRVTSWLVKTLYPIFTFLYNAWIRVCDKHRNASLLGVV